MSRFAAALTAVACSLLALAPLRAQGAWSRVPALPTHCYSKQDQFFDATQKAWEDLGTAATQQTEINSALKSKLTEMDGGTKQARMVAFLEKDPAVAGRYVQEAATAPQHLQQRLSSLDERRKALRGKFKTVQAQYAAESAPLAPLWKRFQDATDPGSGVRPAKIGELAGAFNAAYERLCAKWWSATSPFVSYLTDFRKFEQDANIPYLDDVARVERQQLEIMGVPATGFKSTAEMEGVREHLREAQKIYMLRRTEAAHFP